MSTQPEIELAVRLTHKYTAGWSSLDKHYDVGSATVLASGHTGEDGNGCSIGTLVVEVKPGSWLKVAPSVRTITRALFDSFRSGCRCEHDCCGHAQTSVRDVAPCGENRFLVTTDSYRNI